MPEGRDRRPDVKELTVEAFWPEGHGRGVRISLLLPSTWPLISAPPPPVQSYVPTQGSVPGSSIHLPKTEDLVHLAETEAGAI